MKFEFDVQGLSGMLKTLESLPAEIVSRRGGPIKLALKKAAYVIRDEEERRFLALVNQNKNNETTGLLKGSFIVKRGRYSIDGKGEKYIVTVKRKVYNRSLVSNIKKLGSGKVDVTTTLKTAQLFEWGSSHQPPRKFILPSFHAKAGEAVEVFKSELGRRIDVIVKKLAKQNQGAK